MEDVPGPQVPERERQRTYTAKYKRDILAEYHWLDRQKRGALAAEGESALVGRVGYGEAGDRYPLKTLGSVGSALDQQQRDEHREIIDVAIASLVPLIGTRDACRAVGRSRATHYRHLPHSP
jgi:hypothetical protein